MANNGQDGEKQQSSHKRSAMRALVQDFEPIWFTVCMNAGVIGIILHQFPYQFDGVGICSIIAFLFDFVFFIIFSVIMLARFAMFPGQAYSEITSNPSSLCLLATWPIAWMTLSALVSLIVSTSRWGGHAFTIVGYVMWWFGLAWTTATLFFIYINLIKSKQGKSNDISWVPPPIVMPAVGVATTALTGGLIASYSFDISARLAVPVIIMSFILAGISIFLVILLYSILLYQLFVTGFPEGPSSALLFLLLGPVSQSSAALQVLGSAASTYMAFGGYSQGTFLQQSAASSLNAACVLIALLLTGMAIIWLVLASYAMIEQTFARKMSWAPTWNSIVFPLGTFTTTCLQFSIEMNSPAWRVLTCIGIIIIVVLFLVNLGFTAFKVAKGELLIVREDPRASEKDE